MSKGYVFQAGAFLVIILILAQFSSAGPIDNWQFFATVGSGGGSYHPNTFVTVNSQTGAMTMRGAEGATPEQFAIDMDPISGFLFGINANANPGVVTKIDPSNGQWTEVANIRQDSNPVYLMALSFSPNGTLYGISDQRTLGVINIGLNSFSPIAELDIASNVYGMDFSPQGVLYLADWSSTEPHQLLRTIDVSTGEITSTLPTGSYNVGDIDFAPDGYIYHTNFSWYLFKINPATGEQMNPGYFGGFGPFGGIASVPEPATLLLLGLGWPVVSRLRKK
jgi:hypothetical protein